MLIFQQLSWHACLKILGIFFKCEKSLWIIGPLLDSVDAFTLPGAGCCAGVATISFSFDLGLFVSQSEVPHVADRTAFAKDRE
jgi:hypothetical protein